MTAGRSANGRSPAEGEAEHERERQQSEQGGRESDDPAAIEGKDVDPAPARALVDEKVGDEVSREDEKRRDPGGPTGVGPGPFRVGQDHQPDGDRPQAVEIGPVGDGRVRRRCAIATLGRPIRDCPRRWAFHNVSIRPHGYTDSVPQWNPRKCPFRPRPRLAVEP